MEITNIRLERQGDKTSLLSTVWDNRGQHDLYVTVNQQHENYLDGNSGDPFLLVGLVPAMALGEDLLIDAPVSEKLLYHLKTQLMPWLIKVNTDLKMIEIKTPQGFNQNNAEGQGVGTGISCGVDSFYTILSHLKKELPQKSQLTHLMLIQRQRDTQFNPQMIKSIPKKDEQRIAVGKKLGLETVYVWTNFSKFMDFPFEQICSFHDLGTALALKKLFHTYYYASSYSLENFHLTFEAAPMYDILNTCAIQTETFQMISHPLLVERAEKTEWIAQYPIAQENLNVCYYEQHEMPTLNCSSCEKCVRTMVTLEACGSLDKFHHVFSLKHYKENRNRFIGNILYRSWVNNNPYDQAIVKKLKKNKIIFGKTTYLWLIQTGLKNQLGKLKSKMHLDENIVNPTAKEASASQKT